MSAPPAAPDTVTKAAPDRLVAARAGRPGLITVLRLAAGGGRADRVRIALTAVGPRPPSSPCSLRRRSR